MAERTKAAMDNAGLTRPTLGRIIRHYLDLLGWEQKDLANAIPAVTSPVMSNWCKDQRRPTRDNLWQIAEQLGKRAQSLPKAKGRSPQDRFHASTILVELLRAGGYDMGGEREGYDVAWERYRGAVPSGEAELRVGWAAAPPYMPSAKGEPVQKSLCGRIADRVVRQLDAEPRYEETTWSDLIPGLERGAFDLIAPVLMRVPTRSSQALFSDGIGLLSGYRVLYPAKRRKDAVEHPESSSENDVIRADRIKVLPVAGEVGQLFRRLYGSGAEQFSVAELGEDTEVFLDSAASKLLDLADGGRVPCLITEIVTCEVLATNSGGNLASADLPHDVRMWFPLAFAVHPNERRLCDAVNVALGNLRDSGILHEWFCQLLDPFQEKAGPHPALLVDPDFPRVPLTIGEWLKANRANVQSLVGGKKARESTRSHSQRK